MGKYTKKEQPFFAKVDKITLESQILAPPPRYFELCACSLVCLRHLTPVVIITTVNSDKGFLISQVYSTANNKWTVQTNLRLSPTTYEFKGKSVQSSSYQLIHKTKLLVFLTGQSTIHLLDIENNMLKITGEEYSRLGKIKIKGSNPVFISQEMGETMCHNRKKIMKGQDQRTNKKSRAKKSKKKVGNGNEMKE